MQLGSPHFARRGRYRFPQQQLTITGSDDVAGASLIGSPVVTIGWNKSVACSYTVSTTYRFPPQEFQSENARSRWSRDQTVLFGKQQWVRFPFTATRSAAHRSRTTPVTG